MKNVIIIEDEKDISELVRLHLEDIKCKVQSFANGRSGYEHTVNSHINRLRAKIEEDPAVPSYVLTTWDVGYRFNDS